MMKKLHFKMLLLLCALIVGSCNVWADDSYTQITSIDELDTDAIYIIGDVVSGTARAFGALSSSKGTIISSGLSVSGSTITVSSDATSKPLEFTLKKSGDYYLISYGSTKTYLTYSSNTNFGTTTTTPTTNSGKWNIDYNSDYSCLLINNANTTARYILRNATSAYGPYSNTNLSSYGKATLYKKVDATQPSITTSDINVAYNATSGEISYSVNNEVTGASVSASTTEDWISNFSYATSGKVTFDVSKNTTTADRNGVLTLTYADGGTTYATKNVSVTQGHLDVYPPTFGVTASTYNEVQSVTLSTETDGATIYYTTDGSTPTTSSSTYSSAISVDVSKTIKAIAVMDGVSSTVAEATYELKVKTPTVDPNGGTFNESQAVALNCETTGASIYYTLDGTTPTSASTAYTESFSLTDSKTVKVIATKTGWTDSEVATATFTKIDPNNVWVKTGLSAIATDDVFVIVGNNGSNYAMSNDKGTGNPPSAVKVTISNSIISGTPADNIKWNISGNAKDGYTFYPNGSTSTWLYCTNTNNGTRVGTNTSKTFGIESNYFKHNGTSRYIGIYNSQDWRCYDNIKNTSNIYGQSFAIYKQGISVTLNAACTDGTNYYGTFCSSVPFTFPANVTVSEIGIDANGKLNVVNYEAGAVVPANTGVMISSSTAGKKTFTLASGGTSVLGDDNCLRPSGFGITDATTTGDDCLFYRLTMHNGTQIGFWWGAAEGAAFTLGANKAYLAVPVTTQNARAGFSLFDGDVTTGIDAALNGNGQTAKEVYNLQGQRVAKPAKGLYIVNGKKFINK